MWASPTPIQEAKRLLPLPQLLEKLGLGENTRKESRCPFHDDRHPSFSVWENEKGWHWKCHAGCGEGDEIDLLARHEGLDNRAAIARYLSLAGLAPRPATAPPAPAFDWPACVAAFTPDDAAALAQWRGYRPALCGALRQSALVGKYEGHIAFPVHNDAGTVIGAHYRLQDGSWRYTAGACAAALVLGNNLAGARQIHVVESQWDGLAIFDRLNFQAMDRAVVFVTRGAGNGSLVAGRFPKDAEIFAWPQNDPDEKRDRNGRTPADKWLDDVMECSPAPVRIVVTPPAHKDANDWTRADGDEASLAQAVAAARTPNPLRSLMDIAVAAPEEGRTVLGHRFLCRGGAMLFIGPSGIGKSSASMQQDILWSLGREAFGIRPQRPLRILTIQAENDDEDLAEMRDGVIRGLRLSDEEAARVRENVFYETENGRTSVDFLAYVEKRLALGRFDLLRIDPLQAYAGGDVREPALIAAFLRSGLGPVLQRQGVACVINHHTPKTTHRDTSLWRGSDWMYAGAGGAEITNWARAVVVIDPTYHPRVFKFIAAKRGARIGWADEDGQREFMRYFCHASDGLYWCAATAEDLAEAEEAAENARRSGGAKKEPADLKALVPMQGDIPKKELLSKAQAAGFTREGARLTLIGLIQSRDLFQTSVGRSGTRPELRIARQEPELIAR